MSKYRYKIKSNIKKKKPRTRLQDCFVRVLSRISEDLSVTDTDNELDQSQDNESRSVGNKEIRGQGSFEEIRLYRQQSGEQTDVSTGTWSAWTSLVRRRKETYAPVARDEHEAKQTKRYLASESFDDASLRSKSSRKTPSRLVRGLQYCGKSLKALCSTCIISCLLCCCSSRFEDYI
jgi:transcription antitermination factor NusG